MSEEGAILLRDVNLRRRIGRNRNQKMAANLVIHSDFAIDGLHLSLCPWDDRRHHRLNRKGLVAGRRFFDPQHILIKPQ